MTSKEKSVRGCISQDAVRQLDNHGAVITSSNVIKNLNALHRRNHIIRHQSIVKSPPMIPLASARFGIPVSESALLWIQSAKDINHSTGFQSIFKRSSLQTRVARTICDALLVVHVQRRSRHVEIANKHYGLASLSHVSDVLSQRLIPGHAQPEAAERGAGVEVVHIDEKQARILNHDHAPLFIAHNVVDFALTHVYLLARIGDSAGIAQSGGAGMEHNVRKARQQIEEQAFMSLLQSRVLQTHDLRVVRANQIGQGARVVSREGAKSIDIPGQNGVCVCGSGAATRRPTSATRFAANWDRGRRRTKCGKWEHAGGGGGGGGGCGDRFSHKRGRGGQLRLAASALAHRNAAAARAKKRGRTAKRRAANCKRFKSRRAPDIQRAAPPPPPPARLAQAPSTARKQGGAEDDGKPVLRRGRSGGEEGAQADGVRRAAAAQRDDARDGGAARAGAQGGGGARPPRQGARHATPAVSTATPCARAHARRGMAKLAL
ncbi:hypothetical protein FGB62_22g025 [Gracilaria domingensis]|nr:hypothetical protein FGB62_22g025 [Gracilaria domingensis]